MTEKQTIDYCTTYLQNNYGGHWSLEITSSQFFWNDDIPLREVIVRSDAGQSGYLLVSTSKQTPFLITKAFHGDTLHEILLKKSGFVKDFQAINANSIKNIQFFYDPPFNFIIRNQTGLFIDVNDGYSQTNVAGKFHVNLPAVNNDDIAAEWRALDEPTGMNLLEETIHSPGPSYNQAYNTNCEISGCSPVGWACYAGWMKESGLLPGLFKDGDTWYEDWPSYVWQCERLENECQSVHDLIWWLNSVMVTRNGATLYSNIIRGGGIFAKFGSGNIKVREYGNCSIATVTSLLQNYAIMFTGVREWQSNELLSDALQERYNSPAGHCVVCHGVKGNEILVNMGWGGGIKSRWYNINSISQRQCFGLFS